MSSAHLEVARQRTLNSGLDRSTFSTPSQVVTHHGAMQAQDYGPAKWSIAQRAPGVSDEDIDAAVAQGSIVRTHVLRPTWHFVGREDVRWLLALTGPRVQQSMGSRYRELGLDNDMLARSRKIIAGTLEGERQLTRDQIAEALERGGLDVSGQRLPHVLMGAELEGVICSGARVGRHHTYALLDERVPEERKRDRNESVVELTRRYLASHGPATLHDLRWWSSLTITDLKNALAALGREVANQTIDDVELWELSAPEHQAATERGSIRLLSTYDELIVGYTKTRFFGDPRADAARAAWKDRSLPNGIVLFDKSMAGHWRRALGNRIVRVEVLMYEDMGGLARAALEAEATKLAEFVGRSLELQVISPAAR